MGVVEKFTRKMWKKIVDDINDIIEEGCRDIEPLDEVERPVKATRKLIRVVQDKLRELCPDNEFTDPKKWSQLLIKEIRDAIEKGACDCDNVAIDINYGTSEVEFGSISIRIIDGETTQVTTGTGSAEGFVIFMEASVNGELVLRLIFTGEGLVSDLPENSLSPENREILETTLEDSDIDFDIPGGI